MKKIYYIIPFILLGTLTGCSSEPTIVKLSYGTYTQKRAIELDKVELENKLGEEAFLLAVSPADKRCSCWGNFSILIDNVVSQDHYQIYKTNFANIEYSQKLQDFGFEFNTTKPMFFIVSRDKVVHKYIYSSENKMFFDQIYFEEQLNKLTKEANIYYINEEMMDNYISYLPSSTFCYLKSDCPDCSYFLPNIVLPYYENNIVDSKIYAFDICSIVGTSEEETDYLRQNFKDRHYLSSLYNEKYGYKKGYVPTFQHYTEGSLDDGAIFVNDVLEYNKTSKVVTIVDSYYSEERANDLKYVNDLEKKYLTGTVLEENEYTLIDYEGNKIALWDYKAAEKYYGPFIDAFLKKYQPISIKP